MQMAMTGKIGQGRVDGGGSKRGGGGRGKERRQSLLKERKYVEKEGMS